MFKLCRALSVLSIAALTTNVAMAQNSDSIFIGGSAYNYTYATSSVPASLTSLPSVSVVVSKAAISTMATNYTNCAKTAGYKGKAQSYTQVYSSHFSKLHLVQSNGMSASEFNSAVACAKRANSAPAVKRTAKSSGSGGYVAPSATFAVSTTSMPAARTAYAKCVSASGYRSRAQLQVQEYDSSIGKIALVRSAGMTPAQYNKSVSCMASKVSSL